LRPIEPEIQVSEALSPISVATRCKNLIADYREIYINRVPVRESDPPIPIRGHDVIHKALDYGAGAIDGAIHFLNIAQPWFAANIVRAYFELVLRIMWCRTRTNGWQELIGGWAEETIKAADRSVADLGKDPLTRSARELLTESMSAEEIDGTWFRARWPQRRQVYSRKPLVANGIAFRDRPAGCQRNCHRRYRFTGRRMVMGRSFPAAGRRAERGWSQACASEPGAEPLARAQVAWLLA